MDYRLGRKHLVFDEAPVFDDGFPAYGNSFVTEGCIYPAGTLDPNNGVLPDGSPEFPRLVKGRWSCRGWFVGDGAHTVTGPWIVTTQIYDLGKIAGGTSLVSDGFELADLNVRIKRAIIGGTGIYAKAGGGSHAGPARIQRERWCESALRRASEIGELARRPLYRCAT